MPLAKTPPVNVASTVVTGEEASAFANEPDAPAGTSFFRYKDSAVTYTGAYATWPDPDAEIDPNQPPALVRQGQGVYKDGGVTVTAEFDRDMPVGTTSVSFASGAKYEGTVNKEGMYHGAGKYTWPDGSCYEGRFRKSQLHGQGTYRDKDGVVHSGQYYNGVGPGLMQQ